MQQSFCVMGIYSSLYPVVSPVLLSNSRRNGYIQFVPYSSTFNTFLDIQLSRSLISIYNKSLDLSHLH